MRKIYVLYGWTPSNGAYVSSIFSSLKKAEKYKNILESYKEEDRIYSIEVEVLK